MLLGAALLPLGCGVVVVVVIKVGRKVFDVVAVVVVVVVAVVVVVGASFDWRKTGSSWLSLEGGN